MFSKIRWADNQGEPYCPRCGCTEAYDCRRSNGAPRCRCSACRYSFSLTSGTIFASHKLPLRTYLAAIVMFANEVKGKSMLAMSRSLDAQYKTAFVLAHKLREAMAAEVRVLQIGGDGAVAEIDGAYFGGYVRPANQKQKRIDRRKAENQTGKRRVVVAIRERDGRTLPRVFESESESTGFVRSRVAKGTKLHADEASAWNALHAVFEVNRIDHQQAYSLNGACTNGRNHSSLGFDGQK